MNKNKTIEELEKLIKQREYSTRRIQELLSSVHATGHIVRKVVKTGANLKDANLEGANLEKAILRRADLGGANLERANLKKAKLPRSNLRGLI